MSLALLNRGNGEAPAFKRDFTDFLAIGRVLHDDGGILIDSRTESDNHQCR